MATTTLAKRLEWVLEERGFGNAKALSVAAGLSTSHVGMMIRGDVKGQPAASTLAKIAKTAGVDLHWLTTGEGEPIAGSETRVVRDADADAPAPDESETSLERAVAAVASDPRFKLSDVDVARRAARKAQHLDVRDTDVADIARSYVAAAKWLRENSQPITAEMVGHRAAVSRSNASVSAIDAASADENERARQELEALRNPQPKSKARR